MAGDVNLIPGPSNRDHLLAVARSVISALPGVGGPGVELLNYFVKTPLQKRQEAFFNDVAVRLVWLEQAISQRSEESDSPTLEEVCKSEEFVSTMFQASRIALQTHQQEKLDALRNAVLNTALGRSPREAKRAMFLRFVGDYTVDHLHVLRAMHQRDQSPDGDRVPLANSEEIAKWAMIDVPQLKDDSAMALLITKDLCDNRLLYFRPFMAAGFLTYSNPPEPPPSTIVSDFGREFLAFISEPGHRKEAITKDSPAAYFFGTVTGLDGGVG